KQFTCFCISRAALYGHDGLALRNKPADNLHGLFEYPTRITSKIEDQAFHPLLAQIADGLVKLGRGRLLKTAGQTDVAYAVRQHKIVSDRRQRNAAADDLEIDRRRPSSSLDPDLYARSLFAADIFRNFGAGPFAGILAVDKQKTVAISKARFIRWRIRNYGLNIDAVAVLQ